MTARALAMRSRHARVASIIDSYAAGYRASSQLDQGAAASGTPHPLIPPLPPLAERLCERCGLYVIASDLQRHQASVRCRNYSASSRRRRSSSSGGRRPLCRQGGREGMPVVCGPELTRAPRAEVTFSVDRFTWFPTVYRRLAMLLYGHLRRRCLNGELLVPQVLLPLRSGPHSSRLQ